MEKNIAKWPKIFLSFVFLHKIWMEFPDFLPN